MIRITLNKYPRKTYRLQAMLHLALLCHSEFWLCTFHEIARKGIACHPEAYSEICQISKMEPFTEVVNLVSFEPLTIFSKRSVVDI